MEEVISESLFFLARNTHGYPTYLMSEISGEDEGVPDEVAHYYGHENYGAYLIGLCYPSSKNLDWLTVANVVPWYMVPWRCGEKKKAAISNRLGDTITNYILKVHECDKVGH